MFNKSCQIFAKKFILIQNPEFRLLVGFKINVVKINIVKLKKRVIA